MRPNFLICGAAAGGTSFLSAALIQHPEIYLPKTMRPEPHYFYKSWEYEKPFSYYEEKYFSDVKDEKAIGERSSSYMFSEQVAERIKKHLPDVKLIFMLRNPIERAYANYRYTVLEGLEALSFEEALEQEQERVQAQKGIWKEIQPHNYTGRGFYFEQLDRFLTHFNAESLLILKSEAVGKHSQNAFERVFRFLNVSERFKPGMPPNFTSLNVKDRKIQVQARTYFQDKFDALVEAIRREENPGEFLDKNREDDMKMFELLKNNLHGTKDNMPEKCRKYLQDLFKDDIKKLEKIVDFSIQDWK